MKTRFLKFTFLSVCGLVCSVAAFAGTPPVAKANPINLALTGDETSVDPVNPPGDGTGTVSPPAGGTQTGLGLGSGLGSGFGAGPVGFIANPLQIISDPVYLTATTTPRKLSASDYKDTASDYKTVVAATVVRSK